MELAAQALTAQIAAQVRSNLASTFYITGSVLSGKTRFLNDLPSFLDQTGVTLHSLGPYTLDWSKINELPMRIMEDCCRLDLIEERPKGCLNQHEAWTWYSRQYRGGNRTFLILLDLGDAAEIDAHETATLLSDVRRFEGEWIENRISLHFVLVGRWNPLKLRDYYRNVNISFPYTRHQNFALWHGVGVDTIVDMLPAQVPEAHKAMLGQVLYELTGGHPVVCREVLNRIPTGHLNLRSILDSLRQTAKYGEVTAALVDSWQMLPRVGRTVLENLVHSRQISSSIDPTVFDFLDCVGLIREVHIGASGYLGFRSWYVELVVREHAKDLGLDDSTTDRVSLDDLVPEVSVINRAAYEAINDIENQVRNFAVIQRSLLLETNEDLLDIKVKGRGRSGKTRLSQEADKRRTNAREADLPTDINPSITFLYTWQLAALLSYLAERLNSRAWAAIANSVGELNPLRNAVMHNQLVDVEQMDKLLALRADIYRELNRTQP